MPCQLVSLTAPDNYYTKMHCVKWGRRCTSKYTHPCRCTWDPEVHVKKQHTSSCKRRNWSRNDHSSLPPPFLLLETEHRELPSVAHECHCPWRKRQTNIWKITRLLGPPFPVDAPRLKVANHHTPSCFKAAQASSFQWNIKTQKHKQQELVQRNRTLLSNTQRGIKTAQIPLRPLAVSISWGRRGGGAVSKPDL